MSGECRRGRRWGVEIQGQVLRFKLLGWGLWDGASGLGFVFGFHVSGLGLYFILEKHEITRRSACNL